MSHSTVLDTDRTTPGPLGKLTQSATQTWWMPLLAGIAWIVLSVVIFRFDYTTVAAVAVLFGIVALASAATELMLSTISTPGWRIVHLLAGALFVVVGVVAFTHPGNTFLALAALFSFYLIFRGTLDLITALSADGAMPGRWLLILTGVAEIVIGFWAAGSWNLSVVVLVAWVGASALMRGVAEVVGAFQLRELNHASRRSPV